MNLWVGLVSLFPEMVSAIASAGILGRAIRRGEMGFEVFNPRDHASDRRRTVDDRPYGGGPGMVMMAEPLLGAISEARERAPSPPPGGLSVTPRRQARSVRGGALIEAVELGAHRRTV